MKIDTDSVEFHLLTSRLLARTVAFAKINNTWSTNEILDGVINNFGKWYLDEVAKLKKEEMGLWQKTLYKIRNIV